MRVGVVGAGAIGGLLAANFARAGADVVLVARGAHLDALATRGLTVRTGTTDEPFRLAAHATPATAGRCDLVVIALKAYSIRDMLPRLAPMLGPDTAVMPAINGMPWWYFERHPRYPEGGRIECLDPDGAMARALEARRIVGCVVHSAGEVIAPGVVLRTTPREPYFVGEPDGTDTPRLRAIVEALAAGGAAVSPTPAIRNAVWTKLIGNMSYNPIAALTLARMGDIHASEGLLDCIRALMREAMQVAAHYGETIAMTVEERIGIARTLGNSKISMHQDLERGRPLEVDAIVTSVLELGRRAGIATPMIAAVHALLAERARRSGS